MAAANVSLPAKRPIAIAGPISDGIAVVFAPVVALVLMELAWRFAGVSDDRIYTLVFGVIVTGHHMPGWLRAWGDPGIYARHKARLIVSAFAIPAMVILPAAYGLGVLALAVTAIFDLWHTSMQQHGFARIYSGKAGDTDRAAARRELVSIVVWYTTVVAWSDAWTMGIASALHDAGLRVFDGMSVSMWAAIKAALIVASVALLVLYVKHAVVVWREKRVFALHKHLLHAVMLGVALWSYRAGSWYRAQAVQNLFHAFQYFFMVWIFSHLAIARGAQKPGPFSRVLFGRSWGVLLFGALVVGYGVASFFVPDVVRGVVKDETRVLEIAASIVAASLLLHFYVDSFIWKVREGDVKKALAIDGASAAVRTDPQWKGALHAAAYFGVPILLVALVGTSKRADAAADAAWTMHAPELFPRSGMALRTRGEQELALGKHAEARATLERALAVAPTLAGPAASLAALDESEGRRADAVLHLESAVRAEPADARLRLAYGVALAEAGRPAEAEDALRAAIALAPKRPEPRIALGVLLRKVGRLDESLAAIRTAGAVVPESPQVAVETALTLAAMGDRDGALATTRAFLVRHPTHGGVRQLQATIESR